MKTALPQDGTRPAEFPLSPSQARWWRRQRSETAAPDPFALTLRLTGPIDLEALIEAARDVVERHEILHTVFPDKDGTPVQRILRERVPPAAVIPVAEGGALTAAINRAVRRPFELSSEIPIRQTIFATTPQEHILLTVAHRIAFDQGSARIYTRDLRLAYLARREGTAPAWQELERQYGGFVRWQQAALGDLNDPESAFARLAAHWKPRLESPPPAPPRFTQGGQGGQGGGVAGCHRLVFEEGFCQRLAAVAWDSRADLSIVFLTAFAAALKQPGDAAEAMIGGLVSGREDAGESLIGPFENELVLRVNTSGEPTFHDLLARVRRTGLTASTFRPLPFEQLSGILRHLSLESLVRVKFRYSTAEASEIPFKDAVARPELTGGLPHVFDLMLDVNETRAGEAPSRLECLLRYRMEAVAGGTADALRDRFSRLIDRIATGLDFHLGDALSPLSGSPRGTLAEGGPPAQCREWRFNPLLGRLSSGSADRHVAPGDLLDYQLTALWENTLGIRPVGMRDGFFALGGDPQQLTEVMRQVSLLNGAPLPPLIGDPTVADLVAIVKEQIPVTPLRVIQRGGPGRRPGIFFLHGDFDGGGLYTFDLAASLDPARPFYALQPHGLNGLEVPATIEEMAADQIRVLREAQPEGPYCLGGHCNGGLIAFEMARRLVAEGHRIEAIFLVNSEYRARRATPRALPRQPSAERLRNPQIRQAWRFYQYMNAIELYQPQRYSGEVVLIWPEEDIRKEAAAYSRAWLRVASGVTFRSVPGDHLTCITRYIRHVGAEMTAYLNAPKAISGLSSEF